MSLTSTLAFIILLASASAYRVVDIQRDAAIDQSDAESEIEKPEDDVLHVTSELIEPNLLDVIKIRMGELEAANKQLNEELKSTQVQLTMKTNEIMKKNEIKKKKVAEVKLEPVKSEENFGLWAVICGFAKNIVKGFLSFFGLNFYLN